MWSRSRSATSACVAIAWMATGCLCSKEKKEKPDDPVAAPASSREVATQSRKREEAAKLPPVLKLGAEGRESCGKLDRFECMATRGCTLVRKRAMLSFGEPRYTCMEATSECERLVTQAELRGQIDAASSRPWKSAKSAGDACTAAAECKLEEAKCFCDNRGGGMTLFEDRWGHDTDCSCSGGTPIGCRSKKPTTPDMRPTDAGRALYASRAARATSRDQRMAAEDPPKRAGKPEKTSLPEEMPDGLRLVFSDRETGDPAHARRKGLFVRIDASGRTCVVEDRNARGTTRNDCTLKDVPLKIAWAALRKDAADTIETERYGRLLGRVGRRHLFVSWNGGAFEIDDGESGSPVDGDLARWMRVVFAMRDLTSAAKESTGR